MKKTFKGKIADNEIQTIRLATNNGLTGYKIVKLQLMPVDPISTNQESVVQIFTTRNDATGSARTATSIIDFTDPTLLATAYIESDSSGSTPIFVDAAAIFDNLTFNQDIYLTHVEQSTNGVNFYLELEQAKLSKDEATVATLKDMRAGPDTNFGP